MWGDSTKYLSMVSSFLPLPYGKLRANGSPYLIRYLPCVNRSSRHIFFLTDAFLIEQHESEG